MHDYHYNIDLEISVNMHTIAVHEPREQIWWAMSLSVFLAAFQLDTDDVSTKPHLAF